MGRIVAIGRGDTLSMMKVWKRFSVDRKLIEIYEKDEAVLMGLSAGAICWFDSGYSDYEAFTGKENWEYAFVEEMLGIHHYSLCPHYNETGRNSFDERMSCKDIPGIALENETAFIEENGKISFLRSRDDAQAYVIHYVDGKINKKTVF